MEEDKKLKIIFLPSPFSKNLELSGCENSMKSGNYMIYMIKYLSVCRTSPLVEHLKNEKNEDDHHPNYRAGMANKMIVLNSACSNSDN